MAFFSVPRVEERSGPIAAALELLDPRAESAGAPSLGAFDGSHALT